MTRSRALVGLLMPALLLCGCSDDQPGPGTTPDAAASASPPHTSPTASPTASPTSSPASPKPSASATPAPAPSETAAPEHGSVHVVRTIAGGLNVPWGLALLPDGDLLVTSRDTAKITRIDLRSGHRTAAGAIAPSRSNGQSGGEGGLLGLALSPDFPRDHQLYVYYSTDEDNRIARITYNQDDPTGSQLSGLQVILDGIPHGLHHNGGRIAFGPDKMLYATTGESGEPELSQDKNSLGGKILRMTPDGQPATGNPDPNSVVWSYGHRNVQGLAWDPAGRLWASEFGDRTADELNLIKKDHNYGWPQTQGRTAIDGYTSPVAQWGTEEDSPSGIAYAGGSIWMAALKGERLWRIPMDGAGTAAEPEDFLKGKYGRLRSVLALNDHTLLITTSNTDGRATPGSGDDRIIEVTVR